MEHALVEPVLLRTGQGVQEDIDILIKLNPVRTPETMTKELLVPSDKPVVAYRELKQDWEERGWRIDMKKLQELRGKGNKAGER